MPLGPYLWIPRGAVQEQSTPDPGIPTTSIFTLEIDSSFDKSSPKLKNGTSLSGDALTAWQGLDWLLDNYIDSRYTVSGTVTSRAQRQCLYYYGREVGELHAELMIILRLFGDARALDRAIEIADMQYAKLKTIPGDSSGIWGSNIPLPSHSYKRWPWSQSTHNLYQGTDVHLLDNPRAHAPIAHLLYALRMNENKASPSGYNYKAKADMWEDYLRNHWLKAWQGAESDSGVNWNGSSWVTASGWATNYKGNLHRYYTNSSSSKRAGVDGQPLWPVFSRHLTHTHIGASALHYWLGKAIPEFSAATTVGQHGIEELFINRNCYLFDPSSAMSPYDGEHLVWPRGLYFTGHYDETDTDAINYPQPIGYSSYITMDLFNVWLDGGLPDMPEKFAVPFCRTLAGITLRPPFDASSTHAARDLLDNTAIPAATNYNGQTINFIKGEAGSGDGWNPINAVRLGTNSMSLFLPWDTDDDYIEDYLKDNLVSTSQLHSGGITKPLVGFVNLGVILKHSGAKDWVIGDD